MPEDLITRPRTADQWRKYFDTPREIPYGWNRYDDGIPEVIGLRRDEKVQEAESKTTGHLRPVTCVETGQDFPDIKDAAHWLGVTPGEIAISITTTRARRGYKFVDTGKEYVKKSPKRKTRKVRHGNTNFDSIREAAEYLGVGDTTLREALRTGRGAAFGVEYIDR